MKNRIQFKCYTIIFTMALLLSLTLSTISAEAEGLKLNKTQISMCTGKSYTLKMSGVSKKVTWSTSDKKVVSISKKSGKKYESCTIRANKNGTATVFAKFKVGKKTKTFKCKVTVKGHSYSKPSYAWNTDFSKCSATKSCSRCKKALKQTVKTSNKITTKATCTKSGTIIYTAKFSKYDFGTKTKNVSTKTLEHSYNAPTYTWASDNSACTAKSICGRCNASVSETVKTTSKVTKQATKSTTGIRTYTATFKNKSFATQTIEAVIPKIVSLDKTALSIRNDRAGTITLYNDTIQGVYVDYENWNYNRFYNEYYHEYQSGPDWIVFEISQDRHSITVSTKDPIGEESIKCKVITANSGDIPFDLTIEFVPGEYKIGRFRSCLEIYYTDSAEYCEEGEERYYMPYGKYKGTLVPKGKTTYVMDCNTLSEYKAACDAYEELDEKMFSTAKSIDDIHDYFTNYYYELRDIYGTTPVYLPGSNGIYVFNELVYPDDGGVLRNYNMSFVYTGFESNITSNAELYQIVKAWSDMYNGGQMPEWYYYEVFSDWAEWSGRDIGEYGVPVVDSSGGYVEKYPPLPENFRN